ncbi:MAG: hypothetical protein ACKV22_40075 [Bryobacteraceae bacterium]
MRSASVRPVYRASSQAPAAAVATLPFDFTAVFSLRGRPGNIVQDVISISPESDFVALGISYGFQPSPGNSIQVNAGANAAGTLSDLKLGAFPLSAWLAGIRLNPEELTRTLTSAEPPQLQPAASANRAFVQAISPARLRFLFTAIDTSSGRELQDQPVNNLAALGDATGRRPFRHFPQPFFLSRNATIRLQVTEESAETAGDLFIVLFGYKIAPGPCAPPPVVPVSGARAIPFDYVVRVPLSGVAGRRVEREVILDTSGGLRVTSLGYAVNGESDQVAAVQEINPSDPDNTIPQGPRVLAGLSLSALPVSAWLEGVRLRPGLLQDSVEGNALANKVLPGPRLQQVFQRLNRPEDTFFRYEITDGGSGRDLQNRPILNIAGLGSADGRRPFKQLARPLEFGPRSTIRVAVEEGSGRGDLFLVFQGYRNDSRMGARR